MNNQLFYFVESAQPTLYNSTPIVNMPIVMNNIAPLTFLLDNPFNVPGTLLSLSNQTTIPYNANNRNILIAPTIPNNAFNFSPFASIKVENVQESQSNVSSTHMIKKENFEGSWSSNISESYGIKVEKLDEPNVNPLAGCKTEILEENPPHPIVVDITFDDVLSDDDDISSDNLEIHSDDVNTYALDAQARSILLPSMSENREENCNSEEAFISYITNKKIYNELPGNEKNPTNNSKMEEANEDGVLYINGTMFDNIDVLKDDGQRKVLINRKKLWKPGQTSISDPVEPVKPQLTSEEVKKLVSLKCTECNFSTQKGILDLKRHKLIHKGVKIYKCNVCSYQTSTRSYLRVHKLVHFKNREVKMHKCVHCTYETRDYSNFLKHGRVHITPEELNKLPYHYCGYCNYKTKWKDICVKHERIHKKPGEIRMYQCDKCPFYSRYGPALKNHGLVHQDVTQLNFLSCANCSYVTLSKKTLSEHVIKHKKPDELEWFYCNDCDFKSPLKRKLKQHITVRHRAKVDTKALPRPHKCHICAYASHSKYALKNHLLRHKNPADCELFTCAVCSYTTRLKEDLKLHIKRHLKQRPKEVET